MNISIIIAAYNAENTIEKTLNSLLSQTYKNFEIIIVDDGSTDKTSDIVLKYQEKDKRIKIINQKNNGPYKAREVGVSHSKGEYITFIDADDLLKINTLEKAIKRLKNPDIDTVLYKTIKIYSPKHVIQIGEDFEILTPEEAFYKSLDFSIATFGIFKREIFHKSYILVNKFLSEELTPTNIDEILSRIIIFNSNLVAMEGCYYYINMENSNSKIKSEKVFYHLESFRILGQILEENKTTEERILLKYHQTYLGIYYGMLKIYLKGNYSKKIGIFLKEHKKNINLNLLLRQKLELKKRVFIYFIKMKLDEIVIKIFGN